MTAGGLGSTSDPFDVHPADLLRVVLKGGSASVAAGVSSAPYTLEGFDAYGNSTGDETPGASLAVLPSGTCAGMTCKATTADTGVSHHLVVATQPASPNPTAYANLTVTAGGIDHVQLAGGNTITQAGTPTAAYQVRGYDVFGNDAGDVTSGSTLAITPNGSCDQTAHTCTPVVADASGSDHTVTATVAAAPHPTASRPLTATDASADLRMTKTGPASALPGSNVTYTLGARDFGPASAADVVVTDVLPAGMTFVSGIHPLGWACVVTTTYRCTRASLTTGDGLQTFTLVLHLNVTTFGQVSNTATVAASTADLLSSNNAATSAAALVGCARTITGLVAGDLTLSGAGSTCLRGATVTGKLTVTKGAVAVVTGSTVGGALSATGSGALASAPGRRWERDVRPAELQEQQSRPRQRGPGEHRAQQVRAVRRAVACARWPRASSS